MRIGVIGAGHIGGTAAKLYVKAGYEVEVAKLMPKARLVKAFNTMGWKTLETGSRPADPPQDRLAIFIAGDDREAKAVVAKLIEGIGFGSIDTGSLREGGRRQEPGSPIYGRPLTGRQAREIIR